MAGIIPTPGAPVGGSYGSITIGRNRYGTYQRNRSVPVNPNSPFQQQARIAFRDAVNAWTSSLSGTQRNGWDTYAAGTPWINSAGEPCLLTGQAMFIRSYSFGIRNGRTASSLYPAPVDFTVIGVAPTVDTTVVSAGGDTAAATFPLASNLWQVTGSILQARISQPVNTSRKFRPNWMTYYGFEAVGAVPAAAVSVDRVLTDSPFAISAGQRVWVEWRALNIDNKLTVAQLIGPLEVAA